MKQFKIKELRFVQKNYLRLTDKQIAEELDCTPEQIKGLRYRNGLIYPEKRSLFKKGSTPWNKGISMRVSPDSEFKKGHKPANTKEKGEISLRKDTCGKYYKYIKISDGNWELLQRNVWKKEIGEIPKDKLVTFRNGDTMNCELSNLELISRSENMRRNQNKKKAAKTLKKTWDKVKLFEKYNLPSQCKFKSKYS